MLIQWLVDFNIFPHKKCIFQWDVILKFERNFSFRIFSNCYLRLRAEWCIRTWNKFQNWMDLLCKVCKRSKCIGFIQRLISACIKHESKVSSNKRLDTLQCKRCEQTMKIYIMESSAITYAMDHHRRISSNVCVSVLLIDHCACAIICMSCTLSVCLIWFSDFY